MGFMNTMGKGFKKMGEAAKDYDKFKTTNQGKQMDRKKAELEKLKLETSILQEKDKQKKYKKGDNGLWSW